MPGGDRTGPQGQGSMTGRGLGYCDNSKNGVLWPKRNIGRRQGFGAGLGLGNGRNSRRSSGRGRRR